MGKFRAAPRALCIVGVLVLAPCVYLRALTEALRGARCCAWEGNASRAAMLPLLRSGPNQSIPPGSALAVSAPGAPDRPLAGGTGNLRASVAMLQATLTRVADANLKANHFLFTDSTDGWTASPRLYHYSFVADTAIAMLNYQGYFSAAQILNIAEKFIAARNAAGEFPICLKKSGAAEVFYSGWDFLRHHATGDGAFYVPQLEYLYYRKTANSSAFAKDAAAMKAALFAIPVNGATGLVQVVKGDEWVPWGFQDMVRKTGDDLMGSVLYYQAATDMAALYRVIGDKSGAALFSGRAAKIRANLQELWDPAAGMFYAATGQNRQIDIEGSAYAVYAGAASASQTAAISRYLVKNYRKLTMWGYMRQSPEDWEKCYFIHGPACSYGPGQYDDGAWSVANGWIAAAIAKTSPALALQFIAEFANSPDPTQEYWSWSGAKAPRAGQTSNLESPTGALSYVNTYSAILHGTGANNKER